jgi:hypothetical protein
MRRFSRLIIFMTSLGVFFSTGLVAQDSTKSSMKTVFGGKKAALKVHYVGLYLAPEYQFGQLGGAFTSMGGASFMLQFNKKLGVGFTGFGSFRNQSNSTNINGSFAGLKVEYTIKPDAAIHVSFPLMVGVGGTGFRMGEFGEDHGRFRGNRGGGDNTDPEIDDDDFENNVYKVIQPGVVAEANLARFAKLFVGANYRFAFNSAGYSADYQGFSANVGVKLGIFDYALKSKKANAKNHTKE